MLDGQAVLDQAGQGLPGHVHNQQENKKNREKENNDTITVM
jgi:hypothetical protein